MSYAIIWPLWILKLPVPGAIKNACGIVVVDHVQSAHANWSVFPVKA